uniref:Uncharacterized protein n=1 Tax=Rangifer tarandus platyrhynchus TaxID=3082113 RepID=A0ACB0F515_RANTA|nr:unnamed protein product [Rangifer tarandus platyrhynchus]
MRADSGRGQLVIPAVRVGIGECALQSFLPRKWRAPCCRPVHPSPLVLALWDREKWFWDRGGAAGSMWFNHVDFTASLSTARAESLLGRGTPIQSPSMAPLSRSF